METLGARHHVSCWDTNTEVMTIASKKDPVPSQSDRGSRLLNIQSENRVKSPKIEMDEHTVIRTTHFVLI